MKVEFLSTDFRKLVKYKI